MRIERRADEQFGSVQTAGTDGGRRMLIGRKFTHNGLRYEFLGYHGRDGIRARLVGSREVVLLRDNDQQRQRPPSERSQELNEEKSTSRSRTRFASDERERRQKLKEEKRAAEERKRRENLDRIRAEAEELMRTHSVLRQLAIEYYSAPMDETDVE